MTDQPVSDQGQPAKSQRVQHREKRLKAALKANMAKRKAQAQTKSDLAKSGLAKSGLAKSGLAKSGTIGSGDTTAGTTGPENDKE